MKKYQINFLKGFRYIFQKIFGQAWSFPISEKEPDTANAIIIDYLNDVKPCMIARLGSTELMCLINYLGIKEGKNKFGSFLSGTSGPWWWENSTIEQMKNWSGFFPADKNLLNKFCELMLEDINHVDVLGSWLKNENFILPRMNVKLLNLRLIEPFWAKSPWTNLLKDKKVLVIHPFEEEIKAQYKNREKLFKNNLLPKFELKTIKAVQSLGGDSDFDNWFEALDWMKAKMDMIDYDICLIGAGAYGFPLAAHAKRTGKKSIHLGGSLQLLFGIIGKRWEDPNYGVREWQIPKGSYSSLINENWIRPGNHLKPKNAQQVEGACYW